MRSREWPTRKSLGNSNSKLLPPIDAGHASFLVSKRMRVVFNNLVEQTLRPPGRGTAGPPGGLDSLR